jgi:hypothetical protein
MANKTPISATSVVSALEAYRLEELSRRLGVGRHGLRAMRRGGLKIRRVANRAFVLGSDVIAFLQQQPAGDAHQHKEDAK